MRTGVGRKVLTKSLHHAEENAASERSREAVSAEPRHGASHAAGDDGVEGAVTVDSVQCRLAAAGRRARDSVRPRHAGAGWGRGA